MSGKTRDAQTNEFWTPSPHHKRVLEPTLPEWESGTSWYSFFSWFSCLAISKEIQKTNNTETKHLAGAKKYSHQKQSNIRHLPHLSRLHAVKRSKTHPAKKKMCEQVRNTTQQETDICETDLHRGSRNPISTQLTVRVLAVKMNSETLTCFAVCSILVDNHNCRLSSKMGCSNVRCFDMD